MAQVHHSYVLLRPRTPSMTYCRVPNKMGWPFHNLAITEHGKCCDFRSITFISLDFIHQSLHHDTNGRAVPLNQIPAGAE